MSEINTESMVDKLKEIKRSIIDLKEKEVNLKMEIKESKDGKEGIIQLTYDLERVIVLFIEIENEIDMIIFIHFF